MVTAPDFLRHSRCRLYRLWKDGILCTGNTSLGMIRTTRENRGQLTTVRVRLEFVLARRRSRYMEL